MNSINVIGRLTRDPEIRTTDQGKTICNFSLAIDDVQSKENRADFIRCTVFGTPGMNCKKFLRKGFLAGVSGRIRTDSYKDSGGIMRYPVSVTADRVQFIQWPEKKESNIEGSSGIGPGQSDDNDENSGFDMELPNIDNLVSDVVVERS